MELKFNHFNNFIYRHIWSSPNKRCPPMGAIAPRLRQILIFNPLIMISNLKLYLHLVWRQFTFVFQMLYSLFVFFVVVLFYQVLVFVIYFGQNFFRIIYIGPAHGTAAVVFEICVHTRHTKSVTAWQQTGLHHQIHANWAVHVLEINVLIIFILFGLFLLFLNSMFAKRWHLVILFLFLLYYLLFFFFVFIFFHLTWWRVIYIVVQL